MKSNFNLALLRLLVKEGAGIDAVSAGEIYKAQVAGCPPDRIVYAGVGKRREEIEYALKCGIFFFNVESLPELEIIDRIAAGLKKKQDVCLRLNPDIDPQTHRHITTGKKGTKFGLDSETICRVIADYRRYPHVRIRGIHVHIGSQLIKLTPFLQAIKIALRLMRRVDLKLDYLNIGGGLGIIYKNERAILADEYAAAVKKLLAGREIKLVLEPGRFITGNAGILVSRVLYRKNVPGKSFLVMDAGMNQLLRPALYDAYHEILPLRKNNARKIRVDVVGPICESSDFFARGRLLPPARENDCLAVLAAGAYGMTMASNYNCQLKAAEVLVKGKKCYLVRKRERFQDLLRHEIVPEFLKVKE